MLKTRILTVLVILPVVFVALFTFPNWAWDVFTLGIALVACWEWSRFCKFAGNDANLYLMISLALAAFVFFTYLGYTGFNFSTLAMIGFVVAAVFWLFAAPLWLFKLWRPSGALSVWYSGLTGWVVVFPTWLAFLSLHDLGSWTLLTFAVLVWVADIGAYFVGKAVGRRKLAPSVSPGKTIEGAFGGIACVAAYFFIWRALAAPAAARGDGWAVELASHGYALFGIFLLLAVLSILGDLFESWMKRGVGLKDSSNLLPGHGGVLDRIDALTSTLPIAGLYLIVMQKL